MAQFCVQNWGERWARAHGGSVVLSKAAPLFVTFIPTLVQVDLYKSTTNSRVRIKHDEVQKPKQKTWRRIRHVLQRPCGASFVELTQRTRQRFFCAAQRRKQVQ